MTHSHNDAVTISRDLLRQWPLPQPSEQGDKNDRGRVLIVGGTLELPGAIILAATAALRAGAGRLQIATVRSIAPHVGIAVPEARVIGLPESSNGTIDPSAADQLLDALNKTNATLIGPGLMDDDDTKKLMERVLPEVDQPVLVLDAGAFAGVSGRPNALHHLGGNVILTPHSGEMASLLDLSKDEVTDDPSRVAAQAARDLHAVVALKGASTSIATPDGKLYIYTSSNVGMATSGSGDTLAGIVAGLAARGASPDQAAAWGVFLHSNAGHRLVQRMGKLGFLARECLAEIPPLMNELSDHA